MNKSALLNHPMLLVAGGEWLVPQRVGQLGQIASLRDALATWHREYTP